MQRFSRGFQTSVRRLETAKKQWSEYQQSHEVSSSEAIETLREIIHTPPQDSISPRFWPTNVSQKTTYEPSDFALERISHAKRNRKTVTADQFVKHGIDPSALWKSPVVLSHFVTSNGKIQPSHQTGNKGSTQRKLAKAIRRCRAAGLLSTVHKDVSQLPTFKRSNL